MPDAQRAAAAEDASGDAPSDTLVEWASHHRLRAARDGAWKVEIIERSSRGVTVRSVKSWHWHDGYHRDRRARGPRAQRATHSSKPATTRPPRRPSSEPHPPPSRSARQQRSFERSARHHLLLAQQCPLRAVPSQPPHAKPARDATTTILSPSPSPDGPTPTSSPPRDFAAEAAMVDALFTASDAGAPQCVLEDIASRVTPLSSRRLRSPPARLRTPPPPSLATRLRRPAFAALPHRPPGRSNVDDQLA